MSNETAQNVTFVEANLKDDTEQLIQARSRPIWKRAPVQGILLLVIFSAGLIPFIYWLSYDNQDQNNDKPYTCVIEPGYRVPCGGFNISELECKNVGCCYDEISVECYHSAPTQYFYGSDGSGIYKPSLEKTPFGKPSIAEMEIDYPEVDGRFQVILHDASEQFQAKRPRAYKVDKYVKKLAIEVFRDPSGDRILSTAFGPLIASSDYWEWTVLLSTQYLFGMGQLIIDGNSTISRVFYKNEKDHHSIPAFMAYTNGSFHGMVVEHDGPLEVTVLPSKLIILRSLVGRKISLNLFPGPTPKDVMLQMRNYNFAQPNEWLLQPHLCGGGNVTELGEAISKYNKHTKSGINYGIECFNENLLMMLIREEGSNFDELKALVTSIKTEGKKFSLVVTPHVPFDETYNLYKKAKDLDVLYKDSLGKVYIGQYKNIDVAFLDVTAPKINDWLTELTNLITSTIEPDVIDAILLLDNWPAEDTYQMSNESDTIFSYMNENITAAMSHTIPWNLKTSNSENHILNHNIYGQAFLKLIENIIPNKPIFTSTYNYGLNNPVLTRNINTTWTDFRETMISNLFHSLFSHPLIASPVCGTKHFQTSQEEKVCLKWYFLAASMPIFYANHDWPVSESGYGATVALNALNKRKELAHYYKHFIRNLEPVSRPMFYDYYQDNATFILDEQYMLGNALLVCLPVYPTSTLSVYFPDNDDWFEFWGGGFIETTGWVTMNIVETDWPIFMKAGSIIPLRIVDASSEVFSLIAAYKCTKNKDGSESCTSEGVLRYDNAYLNITLTDSLLEIVNIDEVNNEINCNEPVNPRIVKSIKVFTKKGTEFYDVDIDLCVQPDEYSQTLVPQNP